MNSFKESVNKAIKGDWIVAALFIGLAIISLILGRLPFGKHDVINTIDNPAIYWLFISIFVLVSLFFVFRPFIKSGT
ncbi:hypothetical protein [Paraglaciecola chathamensis]|uniref:Uncharacterized protein n=1 Tax=Paraglaciecola chathamensis S18K6 TaxID=1127672 RepID=A0AAV3V627_9ALTE|nr:hypothetical protein [Paraglaciecola chathamensis]GAC12251.1 hypothetical protein GCHA_4333 [Paraglaciecola chathamensis S18K6]